MGKRKGGKRAREAAPTTTGTTLSTSAPRSVSLTTRRAVLPPGVGVGAPGGAAPPLLCAARVLAEDGDGASVVYAESALTPRECAAWIAFGERTGFADESHDESWNTAHRDNGRIAVDAPEIAAAVFERLSPLLPENLRGAVPTGCNPNLRLYKYVAGQRFGRHVDGSTRTAGGDTRFTVLLYLNGGADGAIDGGETCFYESHGATRPLLAVAPSAGAALLHAHGDRCLTHEGSAVAAGVKYLLRTDVVYAQSPPRT